MTKKLGCLHSLPSNIDFIDKAFSSLDLSIMHFVDPGLMDRITYDPTFSTEDANKKVLEQMSWIESCDVDGILITCTNYIAVMDEEMANRKVPIIKIDDPYFDYICHQEEPQFILFSNPKTVDGTMNRLKSYAKKIGKDIDVEVKILENTFHLAMEGKQEQYKQALMEQMTHLIHEEKRHLSVAQLSMAEAAKEVEKQYHTKITTPLDLLVETVKKELYI